MVVLRAYAVLDEVVVEVTCWHGRSGDAAHLLLREHRRTSGMTFGQVLAEVAKVADLAAQLTCEGSVVSDPRCLDVL